MPDPHAPEPDAPDPAGELVAALRARQALARAAGPVAPAAPAARPDRLVRGERALSGARLRGRAVLLASLALPGLVAAGVVTRSGPAPGAAPPAPPVTPVTPVRSSGSPEPDWRAVVQALLDARTAAYAGGGTARLRAAYAEDSPDLPRDHADLVALLQAGRRVRGADVTVDAAARLPLPGVVLRVVDRVAAGTFAGGITAAARRTYLLTLRRTPGGWGVWQVRPV